MVILGGKNTIVCRDGLLEKIHKGGYEGRESNPLNVIAFLGNKETRDSEGGGTEAAERQVCSGCHFQARPLESVLYSFLSPL